MNKKTLLIIALIILALIWGASGISKPPAETSVNAQDTVLYYGNTCSHCKDLDELIKKNNIKEKVSFAEKEVFDNQGNADELAKVARTCGLSGANIAVPFLYAAGKCLIGTDDIFAYLSQKAASPSATSSSSATGLK